MKKFLFALLYAVGVTRFAAWWNRNQVLFLCYHGVTERPNRDPLDQTGLHVNHQRFVSHLDFLQSNYRIIPLADFLKGAHERRRLPPHSVVLTFDDGFRNFLTTAAPLLAKRHIPVTVFLITDKAEKQEGSAGERWQKEDDHRYLSWAEARQLKRQQNITFGSHTCSHPRLLGLSATEAERELRHSLRDLVAQLGVELPALSYPKGEYSNLLAAEARKVGYACAVTTDRGYNDTSDELFTLGRVLIGDDDNDAAFAVRVSGLRWWLVRLMSLFSRSSAERSQSVTSKLAPNDPVIQMLDKQSAATRP